MLTDKEIKFVARNISNPSYASNIQATKELIELFDKLVNSDGLGISFELNKPEDYVYMYDSSFYTYKTWKDLVQSEIEQIIYGLNEAECKEELNRTIFQLPCGWYVQYV